MFVGVDVGRGIGSPFVGYRDRNSISTVGNRDSNPNSISTVGNWDSNRNGISTVGNWDSNRNSVSKHDHL